MACARRRCTSPRRCSAKAAASTSPASSAVSTSPASCSPLSLVVGSGRGLTAGVPPLLCSARTLDTHISVWRQQGSSAGPGEQCHLAESSSLKPGQPRCRFKAIGLRTEGCRRGTAAPCAARREQEPSCGAVSGLMGSLWLEGTRRAVCCP